ncbi:MAG TPA: nickel-dependent lactate racemase [Clostridiales bacterium]|nr:MAG: hypothetical protein BWY37_01694 [Firmicutes bacterium ADurb.Bin262]HOU09121.1 nickel-dependent lactate racemase [Clostridiales bacterium]HQH62069.1 nickel-dependent lactate racemase [Clostridiales bacterium]HQK73777.1 nickel-dependent lactate racemase [Clostridiales bacterium]
MKQSIRLDYGKTGLTVRLDGADVIEPLEQPAAENPAALIGKKLYKPDFGPSLAHLAAGKRTAAVAHTDITRATPNRLILPAVLGELRALGFEKENIVLVNMTGSHRPQTPAELADMLGGETASAYRCVQHNAFDNSTMSCAGELDGYPLYVNKAYLQADLKICTGFIEPHFFAGFSGGPKAVLPGLCDIGSIMRNHNAARIADDRATWAVTRGNPVWENIRDGCALAAPDFLLNVALNTHGEVSAVFAGSWEEAHRKGCEFVREHAMRKTDKLYDMVITSNSGYPLDMNLYQCVKAMSCAAQIVRDGGIIVVAGECSDGLPKGSPYEKILKTARTPEELFDLIVSGKETLPEQWQAQIQARIQKRARVFVYAGCLSDDEIKQALLEPCRDIEALVREYGGSVAVLPKGPQTVPCCVS